MFTGKNSCIAGSLSRYAGVTNRNTLVLGVLVVLAVNLTILQTANAQGNAKQGNAPPPAATSNTPAPNPPSGVDVTTFVLGPGDSINVEVYAQPSLSRTHTIRQDGMISIPLMGEIQAAGLTPQKLGKQIEQALSETIQAPIVNVDVLQVQSKTFTIAGAMTRVGTFAMPNPLTVFDAINYGGQFAPYAKKKKIKIIRTKPDGKTEFLYFNYEDYVNGKHPEKNKNFMIEHKDTIVVEE